MLSLDVEHVVLTALAKDPQERFASIQAFATALELAVQNEQDASTLRKPGNRQKASTPADHVPSSTHVHLPLSPQSSSPGGSRASATSPPQSLPAQTAVPLHYQASSKKSTLASQQGPTKSSPADMSTPPLRTTTAQPPHQDMVKPIDGRDVLERVERGDILSSWRVLHISRGKIIRSGLANGFYGFIPMILNGFRHPLDSFRHSSTGPPPLLALLLQSLLLGVLFSILLGVLAATFLWIQRKNTLLVLMPEGFVYARSTKKVLTVIHYSEVIDIRAVGTELMITQVRKRWWKRLATAVELKGFESPQTTVQDVIDAYTRFKERPKVHA